MPQLNKGGKYVFGLSIIGPGNRILLPREALDRYPVHREKRILIFTGSRSTGGFCVTSPGLLAGSKLAHILTDCPGLAGDELGEGEFIRYKGRGYAWAPVSPEGVVTLPDKAMAYLALSIGDTLMCIKSSDIAFTMGAKGPLMERAANYRGEIREYRAP